MTGICHICLPNLGGVGKITHSRDEWDCYLRHNCTQDVGNTTRANPMLGPFGVEQDLPFEHDQSLVQVWVGVKRGRFAPSHSVLEQHERPSVSSAVAFMTCTPPPANQRRSPSPSPRIIAPAVLIPFSSFRAFGTLSGLSSSVASLRRAYSSTTAKRFRSSSGRTSPRPQLSSCAPSPRRRGPCRLGPAPWCAPSATSGLLPLHSHPFKGGWGGSGSSSKVGVGAREKWEQRFSCKSAFFAFLRGRITPTSVYSH